jgi:hypothetical protein
MDRYQVAFAVGYPPHCHCLVPGPNHRLGTGPSPVGAVEVQDLRPVPVVFVSGGPWVVKALPATVRQGHERPVFGRPEGDFDLAGSLRTSPRMGGRALIEVPFIEARVIGRLGRLRRRTRPGRCPR